MKKEEVLVIFLLAVLVTGGSLFWEMSTRGLGSDHGFPLNFFWFALGGGAVGKPPYEIHYTSMVPQWNYRNLAFDLLFWFLVLVALYHVGCRVKWWVIKKGKVVK